MHQDQGGTALPTGLGPDASARVAVGKAGGKLLRLLYGEPPRQRNQPKEQ